MAAAASSATGKSTAGTGAFTEPLRFMVAVDGSELSLRSFLAATGLRNKGDHMSILHVADPSKTYLPYDMRPSSIHERFEVECVGRFPKKDFSIRVVNKGLGETTKEVILREVNGSDCDVFVIGMVGRKGPKDDPTILGSTADYSMRGAHCTTVVVKGRGTHFPDTLHYIAACDGSKKSVFCIRMVMSMANSKDKVEVVHVAHRDQEMLDEEHQAASVKELMEEVTAGDERCKVTVLDQKAGDTVAETLVDYSAEQGAEYVAMGADGVAAYASGKKIGLGSVSDALVKQSKVSVIITQNHDRLLPSL